MVKVVLSDTGQEIDILGGQITYVKQVADIADVTGINTSHSWTFKFPKTQPNTMALKGLGYVGDRSDFPYTKNKVHITDNGILVAKNCLLVVKETTDEYKAFVQEGIIEFFQAVSSDKISEVIDLSDLTHVSKVSNIINSFTAGLPYKYIVANYNGPPLANSAGMTNLNPLGMAASINLQYLWDKIFEHYGWTYSGSFDLSDRWMTYPNAKAYSDEDNIQVLNANAKQLNYPSNRNNLSHRLQLNINSINNTYISSVLPASQQHTIFFQEPGNYRVRFNVNGKYRNGFPPFELPFLSYLSVDGQLIQATENISTEENETVYDIIVGFHSIVQVIIFSLPNRFGQLRVENTSYITIETLGVQDVNFSEALIKFKVKDFFKEIMTRFALTSFADVENKHIDFLNIQERIGANVEDWSDKFVRRKSESYVYETYAQNNYLKHKYNDSGEDYADGNLRVNNKNLPVEKTLYESIIFAPEQELVTYDRSDGTTYQVNNFKMFDVEVEEDANTGDLLASYKALKDRFYIIQSIEADWFISILGTTVSGFPLAITTGNTYNDIAREAYEKTQEILNDTRIHVIELFTSKLDFASADLKKIYYFEQEAGYYLMNKLTWKDSETVIGEFVRLRK